MQALWGAWLVQRLPHPSITVTWLVLIFSSPVRPLHDHCSIRPSQKGVPSCWQQHAEAHESAQPSLQFPQQSNPNSIPEAQEAADRYYSLSGSKRVSRIWSSQGAGAAELCRPRQSSRGRRQHELAYSKRPLPVHMTRSYHDLPAKLPASGAATSASTAEHSGPSMAPSKQAQSQGLHAASRESVQPHVERRCSAMSLTSACCCQEDAAADHEQERGVGGPPRRVGTVCGSCACHLAGEHWPRPMLLSMHRPWRSHGDLADTTLGDHADAALRRCSPSSWTRAWRGRTPTWRTAS